MARISPAPPERFAEVAEHMQRWSGQKGYPPNSWLTMLRKPKVFRAYRELHTAVMMDAGELPKGLKFMIAQAVSSAAGDRYCTAHNAENAAHLGGIAAEKIMALWRFRESEFFSAAERAALELAVAAGSAIVEIVCVLALLGWLNRWCQTLAPELEPEAAAFAHKHLASSGWRPPQD